VEVSSVNWTRDVETAAIGGFFDKNKKKKKRKGMPMDMLKKARKIVKNVMRKLRKMKGSFKLTRKDIAVFAENEQLTAALKFAAKKRKVPSNRFKAFRNFVARKFAKLAKVIGEGRAMKALKATIALLKNAAKNPAPMQSKGFKAPKIGRYADESAGWRVNAPGQKLSYIMFKYIAAPLAALMGITMMWQIVPNITLAVLAGLGLIAFVVGLNKYSKRNKKKGKKFKQTV
jgi:hypothetical protein